MGHPNHNGFGEGVALLRDLTSLALKWVTAFFLLAVYGLGAGAPLVGEAAILALAIAFFGWWADRLIPFTVQGVTRWAIDSGLVALTIFFGQSLLPGPDVGLLSALVLGFGIGSLELPLHFYLAARFGLRRPDDDKDGIR
jgi:hypothetical protein